MIVSTIVEKVKFFIFKLFDIPLKEEVSIIEEVEGKTILPTEYLERFTLYPLQSKDSLKDRENELLSLQRAYDNWKINNQPLLVVNIPGEGATSLLHSSTHIYPSAKIIEAKSAIDSYTELVSLLSKLLNQSACKSLTELQNKITKSEECFVIILENIERLFIRKINGFNLLEDFLLFMHATKDKIYWVVSINKYAFYYLNSVKFFSSHFSSVIKLNPINDDLLVDEILLRNKGYDLIFLKPNKISKKLDKQLKKFNSEERQDILKDLFFKKMTDFSKGNMTKSILFSRESAYKIKDKTVYIKPFVLKPIEDLALNDLFILEAIFQHRSLTVLELNVVLRNSNRESRLSIEKLLEKGLIRETKNTSNEIEYRINLMYLDVLKDSLRERLNRNLR